MATNDDMNESLPVSLRATLDRILTEPAPLDLWQFQKDLLAVGGESAGRARTVARAFHGCLRNLESKTASRSASRWGAVLGTAAVSSVGLQELLAEQEDPLRRLLASGVAALLEVGAAVKNAQAWEVEAALMYDDVAWYLYGELWDISRELRPELPSAERQALVDLLLRPVLAPGVADAVKAALLIRLFQVALAARVWPMLLKGEGRREKG
ncbi:MAG TPA: hypothetical protein VLD67_06295 [Vicinamibacterales bacterium]|nr:hypothetical protein [Vicinamibacterales bacterium]